MAFWFQFSKYTIHTLSIIHTFRKVYKGLLIKKVMNIIKGFFFKKKIKSMKRKSNLEKNIDNMLSDEMQTMTATNRTIDKLLKVKIMRQEIQHTLDKIGALDEDLDDDEPEEVEQENNFEEQIKKMLLSKILGNNQQQTQEVSEQSQPVEAIADAVKELSPEQINKLKNRFL